MTIRDLINVLEEHADEWGDEIQVRFASQPSWPFEYDVASVDAVTLGESEEEPGDNVETIVYIAEGRQLDYLPGAASRALGWR